MAKPLTLAESIEFCELCSERRERGGRLSAEKQNRFKELDGVQKARLASDDRPVSAISNSKLATPRFDLEKLGMQYCSGAQTERHARNAVLNTLEIRAKEDGIEFNKEGRVGPKIASMGWLYPELKQLENGFAVEIDEELDELKKPGANREILVGLIYIQILCIRACYTIIFGCEDSTTDLPVTMAACPFTPSEIEEYQMLFAAWTKNGGVGAELMSAEQLKRFTQLTDRISAAQQAA